jgi:hypothetical protein
MKQHNLIVWIAAVSLCAAVAPAGLIQVGPTRTYKTVAAGYNAAAAGDTIEIDSATYTGSQGWVSISKNNLTIRGVGPTRPVLDAAGGATASKGIFVVSAANLTVENLEFANAYIPSSLGLNAAGIRYQPSGSPATLTARNCYFHHNQNGILGGEGASTDIVLENCEFHRNGAGDGYSHNMYIGNGRSLTLKHCYVHDAYLGHEVKTRARTNYILYNRISNESGTAARELQLANGGPAYVIGNVIYQGNGGNSQIITYGDEYSIGGANLNPYLYIVNNTIINQRASGAQFIYIADAAAIALVQNNIFQKRTFGTQTILTGPATMVSNWETTSAGFVDMAGYDFRLTAASVGAIDMGTATGYGLNSYPLTPEFQYVHSGSSEDRPDDGAIDIGAYEYVVSNSEPTVGADIDQTVTEGQAVQLHATASDPDNDTLGYAWTQVAGLTVGLRGAATADASFTAPTVSTLADAAMTFSVTVSDGKGGQASDSINVRVCMLADSNQDDAVDVVDLLTLVDAFGSIAGDPNYDSTCDFNRDDAVDVVDLLDLVDNFGRALQ